MKPLDMVERRKILPDVAAGTLKQPQALLEWVGMNPIKTTTALKTPEGTQPLQVALEAYVNLIDPTAKGVHMSRLYRHVLDLLPTSFLSYQLLDQILTGFLESHQNISNQAFIRIQTQWPIKKPTLASGLSSWHFYDAKISAQKGQGQVMSVTCEFTVPYSSTCPASAALSRQLLEEAFQAEFAGLGQSTVDIDQVASWLKANGSVATPHSQRSLAKAKVQLTAEAVEASLANQQTDLPILELVSLIEGALKTPVQGLVKREDEQAFAKLNGENLMFCEDAGRRIKASLNQAALIDDYLVRVEHLESLHAHDAVAVVCKGKPGGFSPLP